MKKSFLWRTNLRINSFRFANYYYFKHYREKIREISLFSS